MDICQTYCTYILVSLWHTECTVTELVQDLDMTTQNETDLRCAERGFENSSSIFDGVVCYNGTTVGSRAVYICSVDNQTVEATRICGADGIWNGTIPSCSGIIAKYFYLISIHSLCAHFLSLQSTVARAIISAHALRMPNVLKCGVQV